VGITITKKTSTIKFEIYSILATASFGLISYLAFMYCDAKLEVSRIWFLPGLLAIAYTGLCCYYLILFTYDLYILLEKGWKVRMVCPNCKRSRMKVHTTAYGLSIICKKCPFKKTILSDGDKNTIEEDRWTKRRP
jgi:hypothetical protein